MHRREVNLSHTWNALWHWGLIISQLSRAAPKGNQIKVILRKICRVDCEARRGSKRSSSLWRNGEEWNSEVLRNTPINSMKGWALGCLPSWWDSGQPALAKKGLQYWGKIFVILSQSNPPCPKPESARRLVERSKGGLKKYWNIIPWALSHCRPWAMNSARTGIKREALTKCEMEILIDVGLAFTFLKGNESFEIYPEHCQWVVQGIPTKQLTGKWSSFLFVFH